MRILFINNDGGGYADYVEAAAGTTVDKFFSQQIAECGTPYCPACGREMQLT